MHFTVAVIHDRDEDIVDILAPYNEQVEKGGQYAEFVLELEAKDVEAEVARIKKENPDMAQLSNEKLFEDWDGTEKDEHGNYGYWSNPNSFWDWWVIGGRWRGQLRLKKGASAFMQGHVGSDGRDTCEPGYCDSAVISDIDFTPSKEKIEKTENTWRIHLERLADKDPKYNPYFDSGIEAHETKESYTDRQLHFYTFAVLEDGVYESSDWDSSKNGQWLEEYKARIEKWQKEKPNHIITVVDCHT